MYPIEFLRHAAVARPDAPAVIDGERSLSYRALVERSDALAAAFQALAGKPRPVIALLGPNGIEMLVALMAVHASGAVLVPLNGRNAKVELDAQVARVRPDIIVAHADYIDKLSAPAAALVVADAPPADARALSLLVETHRGQRPELNTDLGECNAVKFTGGSSGIPKAVMQSFRCINTLVASIALTFELDAIERYLCVAPMTHGAGTFILPVLARGGCVVLTTESKPAAVLDTMQAAGITMTWMPPTMLYGLVDEQAARPRSLGALKHLIYGGAAAAPARLLEAQRVFGPVIETVYGQTESPVLMTAARAADLLDPSRVASVGRVGPLADVQIMADDGRLLGANELGEIVTRGDLVMNGYFEMPEETAATIRGGWLHTGDVGCIDEQGFLFVKDRIRDVVITGGFNVYPSDVEAVIAQHAAVSEVVVFGIADDYWGERVEAAVELRANATATAEELIGFCKERIGSVKTPKHILIVASLPRSTVGKVLRREAKAIAQAAGGTA
jgi:fatty-acyl-CoA synthase